MLSLWDNDFDGVGFEPDHMNILGDLQKENNMGLNNLFAMVETYHLRSFLIKRIMLEEYD